MHRKQSSSPLKRDVFDLVADQIYEGAHTQYAFGVALAIVIVWFVFGFYVGFTNTFYQLLINTGTTIVTFLLGFLILHSEHKRSLADHAVQLAQHRELLEENRKILSEIHAISLIRASPLPGDSQQSDGGFW